MLQRPVNIYEPAPINYLLAYYIIQLVGSGGHLFLLLLTITSRSIHQNGVIINFYSIFSLTLFLDAILLYTGHLTSLTDDISPSIRIINATVRQVRTLGSNHLSLTQHRMTGMLANTCTTLTVVFRLFISVNSALSTPFAKPLSKISNTILISVPWVVSMPFFVAYLAQTIPHPEAVTRTRYFCDYNGSTLVQVTSNLTLALMCLMLLLAVLTAILLIRLRLSQHGLVYVNKSIDIVLGCRILLFGVYSLTTVVILSGTLNHSWSSFSDGATLAFALTGFWAFLLFLIQPDTFDAIMTCFGLRKHRRRPSFSSVTASRPQRQQPLSPTLSPVLSPVSGHVSFGDFGELRGDDDFSLNSNDGNVWSGTYNNDKRRLHKTHCKHLSNSRDCEDKDNEDDARSIGSTCTTHTDTHTHTYSDTLN